MPTILVVDDDEAIRKLVALVARRRGFAVDLASDGREALDLITHRTYDVAVVDLMMPRLNGYDLVAYMKDLPDRPFVVIVTAMTDALISHVDASIVQSVIRKPFDIELLGRLLTELSEAMQERRKKLEGDFAGEADNVFRFPARPPC